jgi:hypothetical protein
MQVSREKAAENRERITETAARMFRETHRWRRRKNERRRSHMADSTVTSDRWTV